MQNKLVIFYDNSCIYCTNWAKIIQKFNWQNNIEIQKLQNNTDNWEPKGLNLIKANQGLASFHKNRWRYGFDSVFRITLRIPILWTALPLLIILKYTCLGNYIYKKIALKRICNL